MPTPSPSNAARPRPLYVEFRLGWIVQLARLEKATPARRLNALENLLSLLTERWRDGVTLGVARDLRLSVRTGRALAAWVEARGPADDVAAERLLSVTTGDVVDEAVPGGWIRVLLRHRER